MDHLEELALAVSDPDSSLYGKQLSSQEVCELMTCPGREEAVQGIVSWLLGPNSSSDENVRRTLCGGCVLRVVCTFTLAA